MTVFKDASAVQRCRAGLKPGLARHRRYSLIVLLALLLSPWVHADQDFDLAAQNLESALQTFSRTTGMAVLVDRELTRGRRSIGVHGRYSPQQALSLLLTGSGLMARYARGDAFTLQVPEVSQPTSSRGRKAGQEARLNNSYAAALQHAIEASLCGSPLTRPGSFRALVQVWVNADGLIEHSRLVSSTGDLQRDEALVNRLRATRVQRAAPSSLRQPVTLLLMPDTTGTRMECTTPQGAWGG